MRATLGRKDVGLDHIHPRLSASVNYSIESTRRRCEYFLFDLDVDGDSAWRDVLVVLHQNARHDPRLRSGRATDQLTRVTGVRKKTRGRPGGRPPRGQTAAGTTFPTRASRIAVWPPRQLNAHCEQKKGRGFVTSVLVLWTQ